MPPLEKNTKPSQLVCRVVSTDHFSFAKRTKPLSSDIITQDNKNINNELVNKVFEEIAPTLRKIFGQEKRTTVEIIESCYPGFFRVLQREAAAHGIDLDKLSIDEKSDMMSDTEKTYGITDSGTRIIYMNKQLFLRQNPTQSETQAACFTLTLIHELLHIYGEIPRFKFNNESFSADFLNEGIVEMLARDILRKHYPQYYISCMRAETFGVNNEKIYGDYLKITRVLNLLVGESAVNSFVNRNTGVISELYDIDKAATFELCKNASALSNELSEPEPDVKTLEILRGKITVALRRLKKARSGQGSPDADGSESNSDKLQEELRSKNLRTQEKFDGEWIESADDIMKYMLSLFPSSTGFEQYRLGQTAATIIFLEQHIKTINHKMMARKIYDYCKLFEEENGVIPHDIDRLFEFMVKKKLSHYSGYRMPQPDPYRRKAEKMVGGQTHKRFTYMDSVWLGKKLGITDAELNFEKTIDNFLSVEVYLTGRNIFNPSIGDVAATMLSVIDRAAPGDDNMADISNEFVKKQLDVFTAIGVGHKNEGETPTTDVPEHNSAKNDIGNKSDVDAHVRQTFEYIKSIDQTATEIEARNLLQLVSFWNSYATANEHYTILPNTGAARISQDGESLDFFGMELYELTNNSGRIAKK